MAVMGFRSGDFRSIGYDVEYIGSQIVRAGILVHYADNVITPASWRSIVRGTVHIHNTWALALRV